MSDFDKEAERERLREKYEHDEKKREVTEKMSELLLKGATMTNAHCQDCGDPIFRYDGQEFCATCEKAVQRDTGGGGADESEDGDETATNGDREEIHVAAPDETRVQFGGDADQDADGGDDAADGEGADPADQPSQTPAHQHQPTRQVPGVEPGESGDLAAAHAALSRTVTRLAQQAEASEDLGQKRDLLAATKEAAEALSAVRSAGR